MRNDFGGPFDRDEFTGYAFKDENLANEFLETYFDESERCYLSVKEAEMPKIYNSLEDVEKDIPKLKISKIEAKIYNLKKEIKLPFALECDRDRYVNGEVIQQVMNIDKFSLDMLDRICIYCNISHEFKTEGKVYTVEGDLGFYVNEEQYKIMKELKEQTESKIKKLKEEIKSIKLEIYKETLDEEDERE